MARARMHHFLPASYLAGFCDAALVERTGKTVVYVYEVGKTIRAANPDKEARVRDLYSVAGDGAVGDEAEKLLAAVECEAVQVIRNIEIGERLFSDTERQILAEFVGLMFTRTPAALDYSERYVKPAAQKLLLEFAGDPAKFADVWHEHVVDANGGSDAEAARKAILEGYLDANPPENEQIHAMFVTAHMAAEQMLTLGWQVVKTSKHESFITSDFPVIGGARDADKLRLGVGFTAPSSEFYFPLSAKHLLRMAADIEHAHGYIPPTGARGFNRLFMQYAQKRIYSSKRSARIATEFEKMAGTIRLGENALVPMWDGRPIIERVGPDQS